MSAEIKKELSELLRKTQLQLTAALEVMPPPNTARRTEAWKEMAKLECLAERLTNALKEFVS